MWSITKELMTTERFSCPYNTSSVNVLFSVERTPPPMALYRNAAENIPGSIPLCGSTRRFIAAQQLKKAFTLVRSNLHVNALYLYRAFLALMTTQSALPYSFCPSPIQTHMSSAFYLRRDNLGLSIWPKDILAT